MRKIEILKIESFNQKQNSEKSAFSKTQLKEIKGGSIIEDSSLGL